MALDIENYSSKKREELGKAYMRRLDEYERSRDGVMHEVWIKANKYYEGKAKRMDWPWPGASNAVIGLIPAHCNSLKARLYSAATSIKPTYLLDSLLPEDVEVFPQVLTAGQLRDIWQQWSEYVETHVVDNEEMMDNVGDLMVKYGDGFVHLRWENQEIKDYHWDPVTASYTEEIRDLYDHPVAYVLHGKNVYLSPEEHDVQMAKCVGLDVFYDPSIVELMRGKGWTKKETDMILDWHKQRMDNIQKGTADYYQMREDGSYETRSDDLDEARRREANLETMDSTRNVIRLVRVYAREDINEDGYEEEVEFLIHRETGAVPFIKYLDLWHGMRPVIQFPFMKRDGVPYNIGVAEMLFNLQKIANQLMRDHLNNNMIQNTKAFLARAGGPIEDKMRVFPSRIIFVNDLDKDFKPIDMGSGRPVDTINVLPLVQSWAERLTGVNDATLGQMNPKRASATGMLAMLEQSNQVTNHIVSRMASRQRQLWKQCMALYVQFNTDSELMQRVLGPRNAQLLTAAWESLTPKDVRDSLNVAAQVSTAALNSQTRRQEAVALFGQVQMAYQAIQQTAFAMTQIQDPALRQLLVYQLHGFNRALGRIYDTFEVKDQTYFNPDFLEILKNVPAGTPIPAQQPMGEQGPRDQMAQAMQLFGQLGSGPEPINPVGRPAAGVPRNPSETLPVE